MGIKIQFGQRQQCIPAGKYLAKVVEIQEGSFNGNRKILKFLFEIADGPHRDVVLKGFVNANYKTFSEYSKLWKWAATITNGDIQPGSEIDLDIFYGKIFSVQVDTKISKKTGNNFSNVTNILGLALELEL